MKKLILPLLIIFLFSSCRTTTYYTQLLDKSVGISADELIKQWGVPDKQAVLSDGSSVFEYNITSTVHIPGSVHSQPTTTAITSPWTGSVIGYTTTYQTYSTPGSTYQRDCKTLFYIVNNRVQSYKYSGRGCRASYYDVHPEKLKEIRHESQEP